VVGLYLDPLERALVFCVDEEPQIQALGRSQPMMPGVPQRMTADSSGTARPPCSPHWGSPRAGSSARRTAGTETLHPDQDR